VTLSLVKNWLKNSWHCKGGFTPLSYTIGLLAAQRLDYNTWTFIQQSHNKIQDCHVVHAVTVLLQQLQS